MRCEGKPCCDTGANKNTEPRSEARRQLLAASWAVRLHKSSGDRFIQGSERDPCLLYFQFLYSLRKCGYQETCCYGCVGVERQKGPMLKRHTALRKITEKKKMKGMWTAGNRRLERVSVNHKTQTDCERDTWAAAEALKKTTQYELSRVLE